MYVSEINVCFICVFMYVSGLKNLLSLFLLVSRKLLTVYFCLVCGHHQKNVTGVQNRAHGVGRAGHKLERSWKTDGKCKNYREP